LKLQLFDIISFIAILSYFVPLIIVLFKRLWNDLFFMLFATYWAIGGLINGTDLIPDFPKQASYMIGVFYNMLDIPFILAILYCTSLSLKVKKITSVALLLVGIFEVVSLVSKGVNYDALKYPLGAGIAVVLLIVIMEIIRYLQHVEHSNRQNAKVFIHAAVLFEYATFIVIYIFDYFIETSNRQDSFLIYYISTLVAIIIASCGYLMFTKFEKPKHIF
jgi:hypothetical protein